MIKLSELRIGNWYEYDGEPTQWSFDDLRNLEFETSYIGEPIPLTPDWLDRAGFEEFDDDGGYELKSDMAIQLHYAYLSDDGYDFIFDTQFIVRIKFVHQLQNLYFALTGKELTFK